MSQPARILIVDDEPNVRLGFCTALATAGYEVDEAADGQEALDRLEQSPVRLVLLDLRMPGLDGMEVLRRLREGGNDVPVVIITAHGSIPDAVAAMKLGAIDFLTKPLTPKDLRQVVGEVLARHAQPEEAEPILSAPEPPQPTTVMIVPPTLDLMPAKRALNHREFDRAAELLEEALDLVPTSTEALTLLGILRESRGQDHAAYQAYKAALEADPHSGPARDNLRRYCERVGLDYNNKAINPAAG
jgi:DNA-binding response OmpR family regulator